MMAIIGVFMVKMEWETLTAISLILWEVGNCEI